MPRRFDAGEQIRARRFRGPVVQVADVGIEAHEPGGGIGPRRGRPLLRYVGPLIGAACVTRLLRPGLHPA